MPHVRQQLREAVAAALTGLATTGARVHQARVRPRGEGDLPALLVTVDRCEIEQSIQAVQERRFDIVVRGIARAAADLDDTLDQIAFEVETALAGAGTLSGLAPGGLALVRDEVDFDDTLDQPAGVIVLEFRAVVITRAGDPGAVI